MTALDPHYRFLHLCLSGRPCSVPSGPEWRWEAFIAAASGESVLPAMYDLFQKAGFTARMPGDVADFFYAAKELNRCRNSEIFERIKIVAAALNRAGIEPVLLKGAAYLLTRVYPDAANRFLADIDFLVAKADLPATVDVLRQLGYRIDEADTVDRATNHTYAVLSRSDSMTIDLHQGMGLGASDNVLPADQALARSVIAAFEGACVRVLCPDDLIIHHILHSQVHGLYRDRIWTPLRCCYDLALLQQRFGPALDWPYIARQFKGKRLYGVLALYLMQAERTVRMRSPLCLSMSPLLRLRWLHRQLLRGTPQLRFLDPCWFYSAGIVPRIRRLRGILHQPGGLRYLLRKLFSAGFFSRLKADLS